MAEDRLRHFMASSQIRMARLLARREKGILWIRTVLAINRQPITQIDRTRANQARKSVVVALGAEKIALSHLKVQQLATKHNQGLGHDQQVK